MAEAEGLCVSERQRSATGQDSHDRDLDASTD